MSGVKKDGLKPKQSRRDFMKTAWKGLGIIAGIEFTGLTLHYLVDRKDSDENEKLFEAGLVTQFPNKSVTPFRNGHFYLVRLEDGGFIAMSIKCSHLGCSIMWDEKKNEFICPCHSSKFSLTGEVINPPAPRPLDIYEIKIKDGKLFINLNKKKSEVSLKNLNSLMFSN
ncbi:MAG: Rieske (2Fe-2S) protein [Ignavibacteriales bacterium]|nr:Rieske (2Fe-2S) protein [Ignavibacteriales bacterium]